MPFKAKDKDAACIRLLEYFQPKLCLIFCNTKIKVDELAEVIKKAGFQAEGLHGDMSQHQRDVAMNRFRTNAVELFCPHKSKGTACLARAPCSSNAVNIVLYILGRDMGPEIDADTVESRRSGRTGERSENSRRRRFEREAGRGREQRGEDRDGRRRDRRGEDRDGRPLLSQEPKAKRNISPGFGVKLLT